MLVLARSYPSDVFPTLGLWVEQPTVRLAEDCDVRVVSPVPWCPPLPELGPLRQYTRFRRLPAEEIRRGVQILRPRFAVGPGTTLYPFEARAYAAGVERTVRRLRRTFPFDLVHAHMIYPDGVVAHRIAQRYGVPFVVTEHAPWDGWLDRPGVARQAVPAARAAASVLPVSTSVERSIRRYAGDSVQTEVIPVGVDTALFVPSGESERQSDRILYVGWINYNKGIDVLLEAMRGLAARGLPGRLALVGGSYYRNTRLQEERLRAVAASLDLGDRVTFLGRQPPEEVARLMARSAVVVLPSKAESFGAVLVEALACGTPVVATRCGGPEDIVDPEVGRLVPVGDPAALADAISAVLASRGGYDPARLRARAVERYSWEPVVERIRAVYRRAAA